jgi:hypothetical protein
MLFLEQLLHRRVHQHQVRERERVCVCVSVCLCVCVFLHLCARAGMQLVDTDIHQPCPCHCGSVQDRIRSASHSIPSSRPSPLRAHVGWMCHGRSLAISANCRRSDSSDALRAPARSCLFARTSNATPDSSGALSNWCSSCAACSTRSQSAESTTYTMPCAWWK